MDIHQVMNVAFVCIEVEFYKQAVINQVGMEAFRKVRWVSYKVLESSEAMPSMLLLVHQFPLFFPLELPLGPTAALSNFTN